MRNCAEGKAELLKRSKYSPFTFLSPMSLSSHFCQSMHFTLAALQLSHHCFTQLIAPHTPLLAVLSPLNKAAYLNVGFACAFVRVFGRGDELQWKDQLFLYWRFLSKSSFNLFWMCCWLRGIKLEDSQGLNRKLRHNEVNRLSLAAIVRTSLKNKNKRTCKSGFLCGKLSALQGLPLCHDSLFPSLSLNGASK